MIQPLKVLSLSLFLLACIATVNAWQPPQKPQKPAPEDDSSVQKTFQYVSTKLRDSISPNLARRDARYGPNIPPAGHHLLNLDRRQANTTTSRGTSTPPNSSTTETPTSSTSSLPSKTTPTTSDTPTPSSSTMVSVTTLPDGSVSTFTSLVVVTPSRTTGSTGRASSTSQNPSLQGGAASATVGLKKQMLAMLGGAVVVAMAL